MAALFLFGLLCFSTCVGARETAPESPALNSLALQKNLDSHPVWLALIHQTEGRQQIRDPGFVLSAADFSSKNELLATITQLFDSQHRIDMRCKFPARYLWLGQQLDVPIEPLSDCKALKEYTEKVPVETISLVFASANLSQPSSMLGHVFLKLSGKDSDGQLRDHAITFYTDADTINLPKLLLQNLTSGMPGFYSLLPYREALAQYTEFEDRNVWDFDIRTDGRTKELLRLHLFELREVRLSYYFHSYNCATLVDELITLIQAPVAATPPADSLWITPTDVVKRAHLLGLIDGANVTPARTWMVRSLEKQLSAEQIQTVTHWANGNAYSLDLLAPEGTSPNALAWELASTYNDLLNAQKVISPALWSRHQQQLFQVKPSAPYELQVPSSANPQNAPGDSQISLGQTVRNGQSYVSASYLPTSHTLLDDSPQGLGQSELKLAQATILKSLGNEQFFLDEFVLYATQTRLPWSSIVGGLSRAVRLAYESQYSQNYEMQHAAHATSTWGLSHAITKDLSAYIEVGGGIGLSERDLYWEASPGAGMLANEIWGMKTHLSYHQQHNSLGKGGFIGQIDATHRLRLTARSAIEIGWSSLQGSNKDTRFIQTTWRWKTIF